MELIFESSHHVLADQIRYRSGVTVSIVTSIQLHFMYLFVKQATSTYSRDGVTGIHTCELPLNNTQTRLSLLLSRNDHYVQH